MRLGREEHHMPTVSDYQVLKDKPVTLQIGGDVDESFDFTIPNNLNSDNRAVATWRFEEDGNPDKLQWRLTINGTEVNTYTHNSDRFGALQEVLDKSVLKTGSNKAEVRVLSGKGRLGFGDFVIHFQVNV